MVNGFLKVVKAAAAARTESERAALDFKMKAGKRQVMRGLLHIAAKVVDADPAQFLDNQSKQVPIASLPEDLRRICDTERGDDGVIYAVPPSSMTKIAFARLALMTMEAARNEGIILEKDTEKDKPEPFIVKVIPAAQSEGALMIENKNKDDNDEN